MFQRESQGAGATPTPRGRTLLLILLLVGTALRAVPLLWGSSFLDQSQYSFHSDEPKLVRYVDDFPASLQTNHDYRYPTFVQDVCGAVWMLVGEALDWRDPAPSKQGQPSYERALLVSRLLVVLAFGLGGLVLLWSFVERTFGTQAALWSLAVANSLPWMVASTALVQPDVPLAAGLLLVMSLLVGIERSERVRDRQVIALGGALGMAVAMKYTAAIAGLPILFVGIHALLRGAVSRGAFARHVLHVLWAGTLAFLLFVPGAAFDTRNFLAAIQYEFGNAAKGRLNLLWNCRALLKVVPLWVLASAAFGLWVWFKKPGRTVTLTSLVVAVPVYFAVTANSFKPDYAIPVAPILAAFAGLGLERLAHSRSGRIAALLLVVAGQVWVAAVVVQRYTSDTRYRFQRWLVENVPPGDLGEGPRPGELPDWSAPKEPIGYRFVSVHEQPAWIVLAHRHYVFALDALAGGDRLEAFQVVAGNRRLLRLAERDFRFYEDVLLGMNRDYHYEEAAAFLPRDLPLDKMGKEIRVLRRIDTAPPK